MENFNWGEESVKELLSFIHNNKEANMLFWGNTYLEDSSKPVRDAIIEWFKKSKEPKKDYEILETFSEQSAEDGSIRSIKRLSDGGIFSVGDIDDYCRKIRRFFERNNSIRVELVSMGLIIELPLKDLPKKKTLLFTTADGKRIFMGDIYYYVDGNYTVVLRVASTDTPTGFIKFSTKEAAENYVISNKPCLSLKEVMHWASGEDPIAIRDTVIHKLNL